MPPRIALRIESLDDRLNPAPTVSALSANTFYLDVDPNPALTAGYVGYQIQGDGAPHADVYAQIGGFSAGIGLAANAPNTVRLGDLSAAGALNAYFFLNGTETATPQAYTVTFYSGLPSLGNVLATYNETLTGGGEDTIQAAANKFNNGSIVGPAALTIGSTFELLINGQTGTIGSPLLAYTPASLPGWLSSAFQLQSTKLEFKSVPGLAGDPDLVGIVVDDALYYEPPPAGTANTAYTITYTFRAIDATATTTSLTPLVNIGSGTQVKHTDTGTWATLPVIPTVANTLTAAMTASPVSGGTSIVSLTVTNTGGTAASLDQLRALLPAGVTFVSGTATLGGSAYADPTDAGGGSLVWSDAFSVPAGQSLTLSFAVAVPAVGTFQLSGFARIGDTQIDTTTPTNDNAPATVTLSSDTTPPDTAITGAPAALTNSTAATFTFTGSDPGGSGVAGFEFSLDGGAWVPGSSPVVLTGLADGPHTFAVRAIDAVGNVDATPATYGWTVDATAPAAPAVAGVTPDTGASASDRVTAFNRLIITGTGEANSTVAVFLNGSPIGTAPADAGGNWFFNYLGTALADGVYTVTATATDAAGNTSGGSSPVLVRVDTVAPAVGGTAAAATNTTSPTVSVVASDGGSGVPDGTPVAVDVDLNRDGDFDDAGETGYGAGTLAGGTAVVTLPTLAEGVYAFRVRTADVAGNVGTSTTGSVQIDTTGPDTAITTYPPLASPSSGAMFTFTGSDAGGSGVAGFEFSLDGGPWAPSGSMVLLGGLADGPHLFAVRAIDAAGNVDPTPATYAWTVDTSAPAAPSVTGVSPDTGASASDRVTNTGVLTVTGTAEPNSSVTVSDGATVLGTTTANALGNWSLPVVLAEGGHSLTARATDDAGNTSADSLPAGVTVDLTTPDTAIVGTPAAIAGSSAATFNFTGSDPAGSGIAGFEYRVDGGPWLPGGSPLTLTGLTDGPHTFAVRAIDVAGNTDPTPATYAWTVDTTAPAGAVVSGVTPDTGSSPSDRVTNAGALTVAGTAEPFSFVKLFDGATVLGTATADAAGNWQLGVALAEGGHPLTATAADAAGNTSAPGSPAGVTVDFTAPDTAIAGTPATLAATGSATFAFAGTDPAGSGVAGFEYSLDGGPWLPAGSPLALTGLADGPHTFAVRAIDVAGNADTTPATYAWTIDTTAPAGPVVTGFSPDTGVTGDGVTAATAVFVTGTAEPNSAVSLYVDGVLFGTVPADGDGHWTAANVGPLAAGPHAFTATATDAAGNTSAPSAPLGVTVDTAAPAAPTVTGISPDTGRSATDRVTNTGAVTVTGTAEPNATVALFDGTTFLGMTAADGAGNWSLAVALAEGDHPLTATATDAAGNTSPASPVAQTVIDLTAPGAAAVNGPGAATGTRTPTLSGTAEPNATVTVFDGSDALGTATADATGHWAFVPTTPLAEGPHALTATATDAAGNTGPAAAAVTLTVSTTAALPPAATPDWTANGPEYPTRFAATGTLAPFTFTVKAGTALPPGLTLNPATGDVDGSPTAAGTYTFTVVATDPVGNTAERAFTIHVNPPLASPLGDRTVLDVLIVNDPAGVDLGVVGGTGTIRYTVTAGSVPPGMALDAATGRVTGTPTTPGSYAFTVTAVDGVAAVFSKDYVLTVIQYPLLTSGAVGAPTLGTAPAAGEIGTRVNLYNVLDGNVAGTATPFPGFDGQVLVAYGDVTGDRVPEVVAGAGAGGGPRVVIMDIGTGAEMSSFFAYDASFRGGLTVAVGDLNGDGVAEVVTGAGLGGGPHVKVFDGRTHAEVASFMAFDAAFRGGASVAVRNVTGDGVPDIVVGAGPGGGPHVKVYDGHTFQEVASWYAFEPDFHGGVFVAAGDLFGDGTAAVVVGAGAGGGPRVAAFDARTGARSLDFFAYDAAFTGGVRVALNDGNHDGHEDLITGAGPGGGPHVRTWDAGPGGVTELASFYAFADDDARGVYVG